MFDTILIPVLLISVIGIIAGIILSVASKFMAVPVDERFELVRAELPGANCGACGYAGCDDYAQKLVEGACKSNLCIPGGASISQKVSDILGLAFEEVAERCAVVKCSGTCEHTKYVMDYQGPQTCEACNAFYQGRGSCSHACLGFGDCVFACPSDAMRIVNGVAQVDPARCTGCGACAKKCPNGLIDIRPGSSKYYVGCSSTDKGAYTRKVCSAGCIGCRKCEKSCPSGAIKINDNLASIDAALCTNCGQCVEQCPTKVIHLIG